MIHMFVKYFYIFFQHKDIYILETTVVWCLFEINFKQILNLKEYFINSKISENTLMCVLYLKHFMLLSVFFFNLSIT